MLRISAPHVTISSFPRKREARIQRNSSPFVVSLSKHSRAPRPWIPDQVRHDGGLSVNAICKLHVSRGLTRDR